MLFETVYSLEFDNVHLLHESHDASDKYSTVYHFVAKMCTHVHISVTRWYIGYLSDALWDFFSWDYCGRASVGRMVEQSLVLDFIGFLWNLAGSGRVRSFSVVARPHGIAASLSNVCPRHLSDLFARLLFIYHFIHSFVNWSCLTFWDISKLKPLHLYSHGTRTCDQHPSSHTLWFHGITWRHLPHYLPFVGRLICGFPSQRASNAELGMIFFVVGLNNKQPSCRWLEPPWRSGDVRLWDGSIVYWCGFFNGISN